MKIATFNVNGVKTRLAHLLQWLQKEQPDVACLQELKSLDEVFPAREIEEAGYGAIWKGQRSWNGVAMTPGATALTRMPCGASSLARTRVSVLTKALAEP